ncbi:MAG: hypothetical protein WCE62_21210 [Polyangiales bacterium]
MTSWATVRRNGLLVLGSASALVVVTVWLSDHPRPGARTGPTAGHPELFGDAASCPRRGEAASNGRRAEELARLRADRYAYDPRDGVHAVEHYQQAEACYLAAGAERSAARARAESATLIDRVNTDYAAARLNLINALAQEHWSVALSETRRLLRLTEHLEKDDYVEWLMRNVGRVASRASTPP